MINISVCILQIYIYFLDLERIKGEEGGIEVPSDFHPCVSSDFSSQKLRVLTDQPQKQISRPIP